MEGLLDFAAVGGAIIASLGIALSLEWFALNALMKLMPARQPGLATEPIAGEQTGAGPQIVAARFAGSKRAA